MSSAPLPCSVCGAALPAPSWACARCGAFTAPPAEAPDKPSQLLAGCRRVTPYRVAAAFVIDAGSIALLCAGATFTPQPAAGIVWATAAVVAALIVFAVRTTGRSLGFLILGIRLVSRETASAPGWAFTPLFAADVRHGRDPVTAVFEPLDLTADAPGWDDASSTGSAPASPQPQHASTRWAPHHAHTPPPPPGPSTSLPAPLPKPSPVAAVPGSRGTAGEGHVTTASLSTPVTPHDGIGPLKGGAAATTQLMPLPALSRFDGSSSPMRRDGGVGGVGVSGVVSRSAMSAVSPADDDTSRSSSRAAQRGQRRSAQVHRPELHPVDDDTRATARSVGFSDGVGVTRHRLSLVLEVDGARRVPVAPRMVIGRDPDTGEDQTPVTIPDLARQVSRSHAHLEQHHDGSVHVTDLGSLNGTHIDGEQGLQRIPANTTVVVEPGSTLVIGDHRLTLTPRTPAPAAFAIR